MNTIDINPFRTALMVFTLITSGTFFLTVIPLGIVQILSPEIHFHLIGKAFLPITILVLSGCVATYGTAIDVAANVRLGKNRKLAWLAAVLVLNLGAAPVYWLCVAFNEPADHKT